MVNGNGGGSDVVVDATAKSLQKSPKRSTKIKGIQKSASFEVDVGLTGKSSVGYHSSY